VDTYSRTYLARDPFLGCVIVLHAAFRENIDIEAVDTVYCVSVSA